jgi:hypothetical protein
MWWTYKRLFFALTRRLTAGLKASVRVEAQK